MIGCKKTVKTLTGEQMDVEIRAGVETGVEFASHGTGFTNPNNGSRGRFVSVIKIKTPIVVDPSLISRLKDLNDEINKRS
jgi:DnaJ-class molecular chaperone